MTLVTFERCVSQAMDMLGTSAFLSNTAAGWTDGVQLVGFLGRVEGQNVQGRTAVRHRSESTGGYKLARLSRPLLAFKIDPQGLSGQHVLKR